MCTFNTLLLPASASIERVNELSRELLRQTFTVQGNASIEAAVGRDARSFAKEKHCDCGMGLAKAPPPPPPKTGPMKRKLRKLRARGWTEARLARWQAGPTATPETHVEHPSDPSPVAEKWAVLVRRILDERIAAWVGVLTHGYHGSIATERIKCTAKKVVGVPAKQFEEIEEDIVYVFAAAQR
jgi:hypothetical protein